jgi:hypothetical protein
VVSVSANPELVASFWDGVVLVPLLPTLGVRIEEMQENFLPEEEQRRPLLAAADSLVTLLKDNGWVARGHPLTRREPVNTLLVGVGFKPNPYLDKLRKP